MTGLGRSPQTPGRSLQAPATLHGQSWFFYYFFIIFLLPFGFIESEWKKCLHRLVTSLISKHGLIGGWSRGWGCQLYPQPRHRMGEGRELLFLIPHPFPQLPQRFCTPGSPHLRCLLWAKSPTAGPQICCFLAHHSCASVAAALTQLHKIYTQRKSPFSIPCTPRPGWSHQGLDEREVSRGRRWNWDEL